MYLTWWCKTETIVIYNEQVTVQISSIHTLAKSLVFVIHNLPETSNYFQRYGSVHAFQPRGWLSVKPKLLSINLNSLLLSPSESSPCEQPYNDFILGISTSLGRCYVVWLTQPLLWALCLATSFPAYPSTCMLLQPHESPSPVSIRWYDSTVPNRYPRPKYKAW